MINTTRAILLSLLLVTMSTACSDKKDEADIPLSEVPANIIAIVQNTLPGITLDQAEKESDNDMTIYELEGKLISGEKYEIEITESGTILKIELED
jgi:uncharacterized membrane protein YkoI